MIYTFYVGIRLAGAGCQKLRTDQPKWRAVEKAVECDKLMMMLIRKYVRMFSKRLVKQMGST